MQNIFRHPAIKLLSKGVAVIVLMILINIGAVYLFKNTIRSDSFFWVTNDKQDRLASLTEPKIVFVGGSGLLFAIDSQMVDEHFPGYDVVNMGVPAGNGLRYLITEARAYLNPGDVLVIVPEYEHMYTLFNSSPTVQNLYFTLMLHPSNLRFITHPAQVEAIVVQHTKLANSLMLRVLFDTPEEAYGCTSGFGVTVYCRTSVNEYGDIVTGFDEDRFFVPEPLSYDEQYWIYDQGSTVYLNALYEELNRKDVLVVIIPPPVAVSTYEVRQSVYEAAIATLREETSIPILANLEDYVYPDNYFYDTHYHLAPDYRDMHTESIITHLDEVIPPLEP